MNLNTGCILELPEQLLQSRMSKALPRLLHQNLWKLEEGRIPSLLLLFLAQQMMMQDKYTEYCYIRKGRSNVLQIIYLSIYCQFGSTPSLTLQNIYIKIFIGLKLSFTSYKSVSYFSQDISSVESCWCHLDKVHLHVNTVYFMTHGNKEENKP